MSITCRATSTSRRSCRCRTPLSAPTRCRRGSPAWRDSPAPASASRSSTRASGPATARSRAASSLRRISCPTPRWAGTGDRRDKRRSLRARHAHRRDDRRPLAVSAGLDAADAVPRRRAGRPSHQPARHRRRRHGQGQRRDRRHPVGHPESEALQHPRHQPVAGGPGRAVLRGRPDVRSRRARGTRGHRRRGGVGQPGQRRRGAQRARARRVSRASTRT